MEDDEERRRRRRAKKKQTEESERRTEAGGERVRTEEDDDERRRRRREKKRQMEVAEGQEKTDISGEKVKVDDDEERRRRKREKKRQAEEGEAREKSDNLGKEEEDEEERRRRREERRRRKERETMEPEERETGDNDEERRRRRKERKERKTLETNENENNKIKNADIRPKTARDSARHSESPRNDDEKEEARKRREEEAKKKKERRREKERLKEERKSQRSPSPFAMNSSAATSASSVHPNASRARNGVSRPTSPLVDVMKTNRSKQTAVGRSLRQGPRENPFWAPLPIESPASSVSISLEERDSWQLWFAARRRSSMTTEYSIPEDIQVEKEDRRQKQRNLGEATAVESDYGSDFEKSDEEAPRGRAVPSTAAASATGPTEAKSLDNQMADIFRAMNEENQQLVGSRTDLSYDPAFAPSDGSSTPLESHRSDLLSATPANDNAEWVDNGVNFGDAFTAALASISMVKAAERAKDLKRLVKLDRSHCDIFDLPPAEEHQMYVRNISVNVAQKFVQTGEDNVDEDCQTEEIETRSVWTQHPAEGVHVCGLDGESMGVDVGRLVVRKVTESGDESDARSSSALEVPGAYDLLALSKFLDAAGTLVLGLVEEESQLADGGFVTGEIVALSIFDVQTPALMAGGRYGVVAAFPAARSTLVALSMAAPTKSKTSPIKECGAVCVWNLSSPEKPIHTLVSAPSPSNAHDTVITALCWSPAACTIVVGGTKDGVLLLWDLREPEYLHKVVGYKNEKCLTRTPSYSTAASSYGFNHDAAIVSLVTVSQLTTPLFGMAAKEANNAGSSFQLLSMDRTGRIFLWTALEVNPDPSGSEELLGLRPNGRVKLNKSAEFDTHVPKLGYPMAIFDQRFLDAVPEKSAKSPPSGTDSPGVDLAVGVVGLSNAVSFGVTRLAVDVGDSGKFIIATEFGVILNRDRHTGATPEPPAYTVSAPEISLTPAIVTSVSPSPFGLDFFLAGTADGRIFLFNKEFRHPVISWTLSTLSFRGKSVDTSAASSKPPPAGTVIDVHWSPARPSQFYAFQQPSSILTWDLLKTTAGPIDSNSLADSAPDTELGNEFRIVAAAVSQPCHHAEEKYSAFMAVSLKMGIMRVYKLTTLEKKKRLEETKQTRLLLEKVM